MWVSPAGVCENSGVCPTRVRGFAQTWSNACDSAAPQSKSLPGFRIRNCPPSEPRSDSPSGWGKWCAISRRASVFLSSLCASLSRCGAPQLWDALGWVGTAPEVFTAWHRRFRPPGIAKPGFPAVCDLGSPVRAPGICLCPGFFLLLPPPALGTGTGGSGLREEPTLGSGGCPRPGRLAHPGLGAHSASTAIDLPSPPQRPMLDVGFSFPFGAVTNWLFSPSASPLDGQRGAGPGLGISALWRGGSSSSDLCSAAAFYAVQLPSSCLSLPRPLQGPRLLGLLVPPYPQAQSCARR